MAMQNGVLNKDLNHEDCLLVSSAEALVNYPLLDDQIPANRWADVLFIDANSDEIIYTQKLLKGDSIDEKDVFENIHYKRFVAWLDEDGEVYDVTKLVNDDYLILKAFVINAVHAYTSSTNLQNSTTVTLTVRADYSDGNLNVLMASASVKLKQNGTQVVKVGDYNVTVVVNSNNKITDTYVDAPTGNTGGGQNNQGGNSQGGNSQGGNSQR